MEHTSSPAASANGEGGGDADDDDDVPNERLSIPAMDGARHHGERSCSQ